MVKSLLSELLRGFRTVQLTRERQHPSTIDDEQANKFGELFAIVHPILL
jgi:hypothetical protein